MIDLDFFFLCYMPYNDQLSDLAGTAAHTLAICCGRRILVMHYIAVWFWLHVLAVSCVFVENCPTVKML